MAEAEEHGTGLVGRLLGGLALLLATALWVAAVWLALYRPDLVAPFGREAWLAVTAVIWTLPILLMILAWLALRRARQALAEARALHAETDAMTRRLRVAQDVAERSAKRPPPSWEAAWADAMPPASDPEPSQGHRAPRDPLNKPVTDMASNAEAGKAVFLKASPADAAPETTPAAATRPPLWAALDFPTSEADTEGFEALRRALAEDPKLAAVIRTAQHVLSLLAQEGVHLDEDDAPPPVSPEVLRRYAGGARGPEVAALGAMDDRESLALAVGRLRRDPVFRSAARRFIAAFEAWLARVVPEADDTALARIAASRSGRAFRLLGRATGKFG